jgi:hypothetical protein
MAENNRLPSNDLKAPSEGRCEVRKRHPQFCDAANSRQNPLLLRLIARGVFFWEAAWLIQATKSSLSFQIPTAELSLMSGRQPNGCASKTAHGLSACIVRTENMG